MVSLEKPVPGRDNDECLRGDCRIGCKERTTEGVVVSDGDLLPFFGVICSLRRFRGVRLGESVCT